jgi:HEAT repeat protein
MSTDRSIEELVHRLDDEDGWARWEATSALVERGDGAVPALIQAAHAPTARIRYQAITALGWLKAGAGLPLVLEALADDDPGVRHAAVVATTVIAGPRGAGELLPLLDDPDDEVRSAAATALGLLGSVDAIPALQIRLGDPSPEVRARAQAALNRLQAEPHRDRREPPPSDTGRYPGSSPIR